jgi:hypothetical protein
MFSQCHLLILYKNLVYNTSNNDTINLINVWNYNYFSIPIQFILAQYIMPYILIQINEGIVKLVTLMVKGNEIINRMRVL